MIDTKALYADLARVVAHDLLVCRCCGKGMKPTSAEMASYFRKGWPECCGETMALTSPKEPANG